MDDDFAIGLGRELRAPFLEFGAQVAEIFDDAIVDNRDAVGRMRMRIIFVGLALSASPLEFASFKRCDARRIVATIFQASQRIDQLLRNGTTSQYPDYSAHA